MVTPPWIGRASGTWVATRPLVGVPVPVFFPGSFQGAASLACCRRMPVAPVSGWPLGLVAAGAGMSTVALIVAPGSVVGSQMPLEVMGLSEPF